ncbi:MAG: efflux RND transporter periplasmic adaptor subunit [Synoicihabitans sp.]
MPNRLPSLAMKKTSRSGLLQLVAVILFIVLAVIGSRLLQTSYEPATRNGGGERELFVEAQTFTPGPFQIVFETTGTVESLTEVNIVTQVSGRVMQVAPEFFAGGQFRADDVLFTIDPRDFVNEVHRREADLARARTAQQLEEAESAAALAEWRLLEGDKPAPALVAREPQLAEAQANLQAAQANLANAELALERTEFRFPFDGRVISSRIGPGQFVQAGANYGSAFDINALEVVASLKGQELEWLVNSPSAQVTIVAEHLGQEFTLAGKLNRSAASLSPTTRFATVRFGFAEPPEALLPGVFARIEVQGPKRDQVVKLPASALQQSGLLWIVDDESQLQAFTPEILFTDEGWIAVSNLTAPTRIVTNRLPGAAAGTRVQTADSTPSTPAE